MGLSIRAARVVRKQQEERAAAEDDFRRTMLPRPAAAKYLGLAETTLRDWWAAGRGPAGIKLSPARQGRVFYPVAELDAWKTDPLNYSRRARPESIGPFEPPRRGSDKRGPRT